MSCVECCFVKLLRPWSLESCRRDEALSMCVCIKLTLCWSWRHLDFRLASPSVSFCNCVVRNAVSPSPPTPTLLPLTSSTHLLSLCPCFTPSSLSHSGTEIQRGLLSLSLSILHFFLTVYQFSISALFLPLPLILPLPVFLFIWSDLPNPLRPISFSSSWGAW